MTPGDPYKQPYLDSCVYIELLQGDASNYPSRVETAALILKAVDRGAISLVACTLILAEVAHPGTGGLDDTVERWLVRGQGVTLREVDLFLARRAAELVRSHGLNGADAVHLAAALLSRCDVFLTWDQKLVKRAQQVPGILVAEPYFLGESELPGIS
ncbi:MAG: type II toxin-antitoxin system VapC family toxin [Acidimicrobiales bacterium]